MINKKPNMRQRIGNCALHVAASLGGILSETQNTISISTPNGILKVDTKECSTEYPTNSFFMSPIVQDQIKKFDSIFIGG